MWRHSQVPSKMVRSTIFIITIDDVIPVRFDHCLCAQAAAVDKVRETGETSRLSDRAGVTQGESLCSPGHSIIRLFDSSSEKLDVSLVSCVIKIK